MSTRGLVMLLGAVSLFNAVPALAEKPDLYIALGDSITAGAMAGSYLVPRAGAPTGGVFENKDTLSWATGRKIDSVQIKLERYYGQRALGKIEALNAAKSGSKSKDIMAQVQEARRKWETRGYKRIALVTLLVGANDACSMESPDGVDNSTYRRQVTDALLELAKISEGDDPLPVLVMGLPMVPDLGKPNVANTRNSLGVSCGTLFRSPNFLCKNLIKWNTPAEYAREVGVIERKNAALMDAITDAQNRSGKLRVVYTPNMTQTEIKAPMIAYDCFHPNSVAQEGLAGDLWPMIQEMIARVQ